MKTIPHKNPGVFSRLAHFVSRKTGHAAAFTGAVLVVLVWAATGPFFNFTDTWQLVINTGTTIITFLMVFVIQNSQTRDTEAIQIKLDELLRVTKGARPELLELEELDEGQIRAIQKDYERRARKGRTSKA